MASKFLAVMDPRANDRVIKVVEDGAETITYSINPMYAAQTRVFSNVSTFEMSSGYAYSADEKLSNSICRIESTQAKEIGSILTVPMDEMRRLGRVDLVLDAEGNTISSEDAIACPQSALPNHRGRIKDLLVTSERFARMNSIRPGEIVSLIRDPTKTKVGFETILHQSLRDRSFI